MDLPDSVVVAQNVEGLEVVLGHESNNSYAVTDENGDTLLEADENCGTFTRFFLGSHRSTTIHVKDTGGNTEFTIERPFYLLKGGAVIHDTEDIPVKHSSVFPTREFTTEYVTATSSLTSPWTYTVRAGEKQAKITKQWNTGKDIFTDADTFHIDFGDFDDQGFRRHILALAFVIDLRYFESSSGD